MAPPTMAPAVKHRLLLSAAVVDVASGAAVGAELNPFCADPFGRLQRAAARGLGYARPDELELRVMHPWSTPGPPKGAAALAAAWDAAAPAASLRLTPDLVPIWLVFLVRRRPHSAVADTTAAVAAALLPQPVVVLMPTGVKKRTALLRAAADPAGDLRDGVADAAHLCISEGLDLRVARSKPPEPEPGYGLPFALVRAMWDDGDPVTADRLPAPGEVAVARYVRRDGVPLGRRCGICSWCTWQSKQEAADAASAAAATAPKPSDGAVSQEGSLAATQVTTPEKAAGVGAAAAAAAADERAARGAATGGPSWMTATARTALRWLLEGGTSGAKSPVVGGERRGAAGGDRDGGDVDEASGLMARGADGRHRHDKVD